MTLEAERPELGAIDYLNLALPDFDLTKATGSTSLGAWFLGPRAENSEEFARLVNLAVETVSEDRVLLYPDDPPYVTPEMRDSPEFQQSLDTLRQEYKEVLERLRGSVPFFSYRYQAHMNWDLTMPALLGYFAAMLYNQNNVAAEASPVTTMMEMEVGDDLCRMLGYHVPGMNEPGLRPWGHITCDGSVANIEAMWSARNLKYYPIALARALDGKPQLARARDLTVRLGTGSQERLLKLSDWDVLNLPVDTVLGLPTQLRDQFRFTDDELAMVNEFSLPRWGFDSFNQQFLGGKGKPPVVVAPVTMHYSWPKAATLLGIGDANVIGVEVDQDGRMSAEALGKVLESCHRNQRPVVLVVAVVGSTEESAVDPLAKVLALRDQHVKQGFCYPVHADAAWGGYFAAIRRPPPAVAYDGFVPLQPMSKYVNEQYDALPQVDSITVDPHKAGYVPYPAGALCYRNIEQRNLVTLAAPIVYHGGVDPTVGVYGVEGSKPGAAAAAVYLSHRIIRTDQSGYGRILGQSMFNSKRYYANLVTMALDDDCPYTITPFQRLPVERVSDDPARLIEQLRYIKEFIVPLSNDQLVESGQPMELLRELGSDQVIIAYAFNFKDRTGVLNRDIKRLNQFNDDIYRALSMSTSASTSPGLPPNPPPVIVTSSSFTRATYGPAFVDEFVRRVLTKPGDHKPHDIPHADSVNFLLSTTMDPWVTATADGNFVPKLVDEIDRVVRAIAQRYQKN